MKHLAVTVFTVIAFALCAQAGTLQFNSTNGNNYLGEASYQYNLTYDGNPITGMCINNDRFITYGQTWEVDKLPITTELEMQAAWLYERAGNGSNSDYQGAVWYLFNNATTLTPGAATLVALAGSQTFTPGEFNGLSILVPDDGGEGEDALTVGTPQTFIIGSTPEPSTLLMLGTSLVGMFGFRKRLF